MQLDASTPGHAWVLSLFVQMLYYSLTVMTTTGVPRPSTAVPAHRAQFGDIHPSGTFYLYLLVSLQMLVGACRVCSRPR